MNKIIKLDKEAVLKLPEQHTEQSELIIALFKMVFPDFDEIEKVDGHPVINKDTNYILTDMFIAFDIKHHPTVFKGGIWLSYGFSSYDVDPDLPDWSVDISNITVQYKNKMAVNS